MVNVLWWEWSEQVKTNRRTAYLAKLLYDQGGVTLMDVAPADEDLSDSGLEGFLARASSPSSDAVVTRRDGRIIVDNVPLVSQSNDETSNSGAGKSGHGGGNTTAKPSASRRSQSPPKSSDSPTKPASSPSASSPKRIGYGMMLDSSALSDTPADAKPSALGAAARRARVRRPQSSSTTRPTARTSSSSSEKSLATPSTAKKRGPTPRRVARRRKPEDGDYDDDDTDTDDTDDA